MADLSRWEHKRSAVGGPPPGPPRMGLTGGGYLPGMANEEDRAVCSAPIETEDGEQVVICQQNAGPGNQVGGGEFKNGTLEKSPEKAAQEQDRLEAEAPASQP